MEDTGFVKAFLAAAGDICLFDGCICLKQERERFADEVASPNLQQRKERFFAILVKETNEKTRTVPRPVRKKNES